MMLAERLAAFAPHGFSLAQERQGPTAIDPLLRASRVWIVGGGSVTLELHTRRLPDPLRPWFARGDGVESPGLRDLIREAGLRSLDLGRASAVPLATSPPCLALVWTDRSVERGADGTCSTSHQSHCRLFAGIDDTVVELVLREQPASAPTEADLAALTTRARSLWTALFTSAPAADATAASYDAQAFDMLVRERGPVDPELLVELLGYAPLPPAALPPFLGPAAFAHISRNALLPPETRAALEAAQIQAPTQFAQEAADLARGHAVATAAPTAVRGAAAAASPHPALAVATPDFAKLYGERPVPHRPGRVPTDELFADPRLPAALVVQLVADTPTIKNAGHRELLHDAVLGILFNRALPRSLRETALAHGVATLWPRASAPSVSSMRPRARLHALHGLDADGFALFAGLHDPAVDLALAALPDIPVATMCSLLRDPDSNHGRQVWRVLEHNPALTTEALIALLEARPGIRGAHRRAAAQAQLSQHAMLLLAQGPESDDALVTLAQRPDLSSQVVDALIARAPSSAMYGGIMRALDALAANAALDVFCLQRLEALSRAPHLQTIRPTIARHPLAARVLRDGSPIDLPTAEVLSRRSDLDDEVRARALRLLATSGLEGHRCTAAAQPDLDGALQDLLAADPARIVRCALHGNTRGVAAVCRNALSSMDALVRFAGGLSTPAPLRPPRDAHWSDAVAFARNPNAVDGDVAALADHTHPLVRAAVALRGASTVTDGDAR